MTDGGRVVPPQSSSSSSWPRPSRRQWTSPECQLWTRAAAAESETEGNFAFRGWHIPGRHKFISDKNTPSGLLLWWRRQWRLLNMQVYGKGNLSPWGIFSLREVDLLTHILVSSYCTFFMGAGGKVLLRNKFATTGDMPPSGEELRIWNVWSERTKWQCLQAHSSSKWTRAP